MATEYSEEILTELCEYLEEGLFLREACALAGVSHPTIYKLLKQGNKDINKGEYDTPEAEFTTALKQAKAKAEQTALKNIRSAGKLPAFWQAEAWYLERVMPDKYGRRDRVALDHSGNMNLGIADVNKPMSERVDDAAKRQEVVRLAGSLDFIEESEDSPEPGADSVRTSGDEWEDESSETSEVSEWEIS